ncbi:MAG: proline dehydrogenase family protein [Acidimicrobiales bacterium]
MHGWEQAPFRTKADTDANYKRCLDWVLRPEHLTGLRIGVASHNLFDIAWAHLLSSGRGVSSRVEFEMLQGMAPAQSRVVKADTGSVLLYTPAVADTDFDVAISYLFRRLEENAAPENFMHSLFDLGPGGAGFSREEAGFRAAVMRRDLVPDSPFRTQNRLDEVVDIRDSFDNEADTDPRLAANRAWAAQLVSAPASGCQTEMTTSVDGIDAIVEAATRAKAAWSARSGVDRQAVLLDVAHKMSQQRGAFISEMVSEASKSVAQADPEVSEAIDFARYYAERAAELEAVDGAEFTPAGVALIVPPWNFPVAIPAGGVLAALAAGNTVILKPAPETPRCAELIAEACWEAGVPRDVLHFVRCPDDEVGQRLVTHPDVDVVILTGSLETANLFRSWEPRLNLLAETSGKNALVISPSADLDLAVADLVASAFGHSGQKCSAASLAICLGSVYDSDRFRRQLKDAVESIRVGPAHDLQTLMNPLVGPAEGKLLRALTTLDPGEEWLVEPKKLDDTGQTWSPGVKLGVVAGSWFHQTECFGPVLGVMRAEDLDEAIALQNASSFGLTGGLHTLDPDEVDVWLDRVEVGNAYVSRGITGAIVRRQPFGGWKQSAVGPGAKAGGPNYVVRLGTWIDSAERTDAWLAAATESDERWMADEFGRSHDPTGLWCEANELRYRPLARVAIRVAAGGDEVEVRRCVAAAERVGAGVEVSRETAESDASFAADWVVRPGALCGRARVDLCRAAIDAGVYLATMPVVGSGRLELLNYLREQAVSRTLHRFGNVADTAS